MIEIRSFLHNSENLALLVASLSIARLATLLGSLQFTFHLPQQLRQRLLFSMTCTLCRIIVAEVSGASLSSTVAAMRQQMELSVCNGLQPQIMSRRKSSITH